MAYGFNDDKTKYEINSGEYVQIISGTGTPTNYNNEIAVAIYPTLTNETFNSEEDAEAWIAEHVVGVLGVWVDRDDSYTNTEPAIAGYGVGVLRRNPRNNIYGVQAFIRAKPSSTTHSYNGYMKLKMR